MQVPKIVTLLELTQVRTLWEKYYVIMPNLLMISH